MRTLFLATIVTITSATPLFAQLQASSIPRPAQDIEGVEVLTRGPIHEAFAETITFDPQEGVIVPKAPPEAIEELPPDERPEGENVAWIAGYWAWDDEREDHLWVSGIWRALPPGRQWVPGYWAQHEVTQSRQGAQWISGYWADAEAVETEYLPEPPATIEVGPNIDAPSIDHRWLPGCWIWQQSRYAWRPGYWSVGQNNWTWIPAHYVWTPRGYVFVDGYYDFDTNQRGIVYAPVYFSSQVYTQRNYSYSPNVAINPAVLISHLFLRPTYGHYYFGDYYGGNYANRGFSSWYSYNSNRRVYDPFYAQQSWVHRQNHQQWQRSIEDNFHNYRDNEIARPPRTWQDQRTRMASAGARDRQDLLIAASLPELAKTQNNPIRFQKLEAEDRNQIAKHQQSFNQFRNERQRLESQVIAARPDLDAKEPRDLPAAKIKLPKSPIVAKPMEKIAKEKAPPKREEAPPPDMKVEPQPRKPQPKASQPRTPRDPAPTPPKADAPKKDPRMEPRTDPRDVPRNEPRDKPGNQPRPDPRNEPRNTPRTDPRDNPSKPPVTNPKNPPQNQPKNPKPKDPAPAPKQPMPKQPAPKQPAPRQDPPKQAPPPRQPAPKQPAPKQPAPKQDPPKAQAPRQEPRGNPQQPKDKPKGPEKNPEKDPEKNPKG